MKMEKLDPWAEWLEADGLGGFASGTVGGARTRRYHALLLPALNPPTGRVALVNGFEAEVITDRGTEAISTQSYAPGVLHPRGLDRLISFERDPWPRWLFTSVNAECGIEQEILALHQRSAVVLRWRATGLKGSALLRVRPLLSGRDYHQLHRENGAFRFDHSNEDGTVVWRPYEGLPAIHASATGHYEHAPSWFRNFLYEEERRRGLDDTEDLASPGHFTFDLARGDATLILSAGDERFAAEEAESLIETERTRRARLGGPLLQAADAYIVKRGAGSTIIAGYPWFTDWGRDTFIALRGLCLSVGRLDLAREILLAWSGHVSEGMLPNRFPDAGEQAEYNSVDASLWYVVAAYEWMEAAGSALKNADRNRLRQAIELILGGYSQGTRFGIRADRDGLLAAGEAGVQLTWMDAKVGEWVVTPRIGKPVEIQALWINALRAAGTWNPHWAALAHRATESFEKRFWSDDLGHLFDVVDVDHESGVCDAQLRPNQILAVGGLPWSILIGERARRVVESVESHLLTPVGLRSLAPDDPDYRPRYQGGVWDRDGAYHQGTVWPWLFGPFVSAWLNVRGNDAAARKDARRLFLESLEQHLAEAGMGHISEIADAEPPHTPRGCPFQAWSLSEFLRIRQLLSSCDSGKGAVA